MTVLRSPPGIPSPVRLEGWLNDAVGGEPADLVDIQLIAGGRSNLTYRLALWRPSGSHLLVLRRPPLGHVLPTAHDMSREYRVLLALAGTRVPVAQPVAFCDDAEVIGAPFYLMEHVPGAVIRTRQDAAVLTEPQARDLSEGLADMLAAIHGVDVEAVGLSGLGRGAGYLSRQLDRWQRQWDLSVTREVPGYPELVARLTDRLPAEGETTLVHGDFRLDNVLVTVSPRPRITAVVDWEMATLGDPLADLGLTLVYWTDPGEEGWLRPESGAVDSPGIAHGGSTDATASPGFLTRAEFAAGYATRTGRDISRIGYYVAFGYFKLAVVLEGINARYLQNQTVGEGFDQDGRAVPALVTRAHEVLDADL
ncbi:MAG TPA: phosphotransferase family protein [Streptosporangiaceae bacterium]|jgi:aminoglycoside phosphotransferase (APT) family kinase protein|nr:phosphotransferase family protein [Streptosporangiaceae bacterium]HEX2822544.1 phosphotransferase family protein [Streptosporangiaceae bacterium]